MDIKAQLVQSMPKLHNSVGLHGFVGGINTKHVTFCQYCISPKVIIVVTHL